MTDEALTPKNIISRCLADFVRRGGLTEANVDDAAKAVLESLKLFGVAENCDYILPCDVKLPPATTITKGCTLSTLMAAFRVRERGWPQVTSEQIAAVDKLLKPEFEGGDWQEVENEA